MSMPPTSPRLKFVHTHPGRSPIPRRPPRHPSSPSARSRSLELLDQTESKNEPPIVEPESLPRPRSRSLDGLLDDDGVAEPEESASRTRSRSLNASTEEPIEDSTKTAEEIGEKNVSRNSVPESETNKRAATELAEVSPRRRENNEERSPMPVPRLKAKNSAKAEAVDAAKTARLEDSRISSSSEESAEKFVGKLPTDDTRPAFEESAEKFVGKLPTDDTRPAFEESAEKFVGKLPTDDTRSAFEDYGEIFVGNLPTDGAKSGIDDDDRTGDCCDSDARTSRWERDGEKPSFVAPAKESSCTLLKAKSCGAGLDSDESYSSNDYNRNGADIVENKNKVQQQRGSLLALHAACAADPKRKRNFMNKCVNKVRSLIKK